MWSAGACPDLPHPAPNHRAASRPTKGGRMFPHSTGDARTACFDGDRTHDGSSSPEETLPVHPMKIMGLDVGDRRIGVATCDPLEIVASPREVVKRNGHELAFLERFVRDEEIELV